MQPHSHRQSVAKHLNRFGSSTTSTRSRVLNRLSIILSVMGITLMVSMLALAGYLLLFNYSGDADERSRASMWAVFAVMDNAVPDARPELAQVLSQTLLPVDYKVVANPVPDTSRPQLAAAVIEFLTIQLDDETRTQFALSDGHVIEIGSQALTGSTRPSLWIALSLLALLMLIALSLWALTRYLSPVQRVVDAADQLSLEQEMQPL